MCKIYVLMMFWIADLDSSCNLSSLSSWPTSQSVTGYPNIIAIIMKTIGFQSSNSVSPNNNLVEKKSLDLPIEWLHCIIDLEDTQNLRDIKGWELNKGGKFSCPWELYVVIITQLSPIFSSLPTFQTRFASKMAFKFNMRDIHHPNNEHWLLLEHAHELQSWETKPSHVWMYVFLVFTKQIKLFRFLIHSVVRILKKSKISTLLVA